MQHMLLTATTTFCWPRTSTGQLLLSIFFSRCGAWEEDWELLGKVPLSKSLVVV